MYSKSHDQAATVASKQIIYLRIPTLQCYEFDQYMCLVANNVTR